MSFILDFFVLKQPGLKARDLFVCKLLKKATQKKQPVLVLCEDNNQAQALDTLLWTFQDTSFIPHSLSDDLNASEAPIRLSTSMSARREKDVILNLSEKIPDDFQLAPRLIEIVPVDEPYKTNARERFKHYRQLGFTPNTTEIPYDF